MDWALQLHPLATEARRAPPRPKVHPRGATIVRAFAAGTPALALASGWVERMDGDGRVYCAKADTDHTSWQPPTASRPARPAALAKAALARVGAQAAAKPAGAFGGEGGARRRVSARRDAAPGWLFTGISVPK